MVSKSMTVFTTKLIGLGDHHVIQTGWLVNPADRSSDYQLNRDEILIQLDIYLLPFIPHQNHT